MGSSLLPPDAAMRWTAWQKAAVIRAVRDGSLTVAEVCSRYLLSEEEFAAWRVAFERSGIAGLQLKSLRQQRRPNRARR